MFSTRFYGQDDSLIKYNIIKLCGEHNTCKRILQPPRTRQVFMAATSEPTFLFYSRWKGVAFGEKSHALTYILPVCTLSQNLCFSHPMKTFPTRNPNRCFVDKNYKYRHPTSIIKYFRSERDICEIIMCTPKFTNQICVQRMHHDTVALLSTRSVIACICDNIAPKKIKGCRMW
jgi:hypothetical protein